MLGFLLGLHIVVTLIMIVVILLQKSDSGGGLIGNSNAFTARGAANFLTRLTAILAFIFMSNCIVMTVLVSHKVKQPSLLFETPSSPKKPS